MRESLIIEILFQTKSGNQQGLMVFFLQQKNEEISRTQKKENKKKYVST